MRKLAKTLKRSGICSDFPTEQEFSHAEEAQHKGQLERVEAMKSGWAGVVAQHCVNWKLAKLYRNRERFVVIESKQEGSESWLDQLEIQVERIMNDMRESVQYLQE